MNFFGYMKKVWTGVVVDEAETTTPDMVEHDKRYHGGHAPEGSCKFREEIKSMKDEDTVSKGNVSSGVERMISVLKRWMPGCKINQVTQDDVRRLVSDNVRKSISGIYTGSAADYEKPSLQYIGTGEGSQVYGWGLYGSSERGVANKYAEARSSEPDMDTLVSMYSEFLPEGVAERAAKAMESTGNIYDAADILGDDGDILIEFQDDVRSAYDYSMRRAIVYEQTFFTNRAPGDESHLLNWYEPIGKENFDRIVAQAEKEPFAKSFDKKQKSSKRFGFDENTPAGEVYNKLSTFYFRSPKEASEFMARADIDGVKYPVDSYGKQVKNGDEAGWNYVSFRDDNIRVDHKWVDGEKRFHILKNEFERWNRILDDYDSGKLKTGQRLTVWDKTPAVLIALGAPNLPITVDKQILDKITGIVPTKTGENHGVPVSELRNIQIELDNPIAVFESTKGNDAFVVLTRMVDRQNNERAVVALKTDVVNGAIRVNPIASTYGKSKKSIENWMAFGLLRYINKQARKSSARWLQLPSDSDLRAHSVLTEKDFSTEQLGYILPSSKQVVNGDIAGFYDRDSGEISLVEGLATPETVAHELGWHATFHWAEKNHPELHAKLMQYARESTDGIKKSVVEKYGHDLDEKVLLDEIGAERFTREDISPLIEAASRKESEEWFDKVEGAQNDVRREFVKSEGQKLGKAEIDRIAALPPKKAVEELVKAMVAGKTLAMDAMESDLMKYLQEGSGKPTSVTEDGLSMVYRDDIGRIIGTAVSFGGRTVFRDKYGRQVASAENFS